ncbi:MAG: T9SS type A sorting domain-containing protein, partial [Calditrichaeota bacterium]|nr:T9SS type A sorting domain-containing protein [Calditrichota bacterium]
NIEIFDNYAFTVGMNFDVFDISDMTAPVRIASLDISTLNVIDHSGDYIYGVDGAYLRIIDISDPENPEISVRFDDISGPRNIEVVDDYAYIPGTGRFYIVDISSPEEPEIVGSSGYSHGGANRFSVEIIDNYAFIADGVNIYTFDISNPEEVNEIGRVDVVGFLRDIDVSGDFLYAASNLNLEFLRTYDISNPAHLRQVGSLEFDTADLPMEMEIEGDYAYIAASREGLQIIDISDPYNPEIAGFYDTPHWAHSIEVRDSYVFLVDGWCGLFIIRNDHLNSVSRDISTLSNNHIGFIANYPNPFNSETVVNYYLPFRTQLTLNVYNSSGRLISQLYNGFQLAGDHSTIWRQINLPSGLYFVRLEAAGEVQLQKVMLIK